MLIFDLIASPSEPAHVVIISQAWRTDIPYPDVRDQVLRIKYGYTQSQVICLLDALYPYGHCVTFPPGMPV